MTVFLVVGDIGESEPIQMPGGTTVLGRGPPLNIMDERLSRQQAEITVESDGVSVTIKSIGLNACYLKEKDSSELQRLGTDVECDIYHGDEYFLAGLVKLTAVVVSPTGPPPMRTGNSGAKVVAAGTGGFSPKATKLTTTSGPTSRKRSNAPRKQSNTRGDRDRKQSKSGTRKPATARQTGVSAITLDGPSGGRGVSGSGAGGRGRGRGRGAVRAPPGSGGETQAQADEIGDQLYNLVQGTSFEDYEEWYLKAKALRTYTLPSSDMDYYNQVYTDWKHQNDIRKNLERAMRKGVDGIGEIERYLKKAEDANDQGFLTDIITTASTKLSDLKSAKKGRSRYN